MNVGHDSTNNIMTDVCLQKRTVFLKGRGLFPSWTKKRKLWASTGCVSFGRMTIDDGSIL